MRMPPGLIHTRLQLITVLGLYRVYTFQTVHPGDRGGGQWHIYSRHAADPYRGISLNYSVTCNFWDWMCTLRDMLAVPILYRTGMEIMAHGLLASINQRSMAITTLNKEVLMEKQSYYTGLYNSTIQGILKNMRVPSDVNCFHCNRGIGLYHPAMTLRNS
jgi:hypothetical protein